MLTPRKIDVLTFGGKRYVTDTPRFRKRLYPGDKDGSVARRDLNELVAAGLLNKCEHRVVQSGQGGAPTIYFPSANGLRFLALHTGDMRWLSVCSQKPYEKHLEHFLGLGDVRMIVEDAIARQSVVTLDSYFNEFDVVNHQAHRDQPEKRFKLYTLISENPRKVCAPDGGLGLRFGDYLLPYYIELERGTSSPEETSKTKSPGFAEVLEKKLHLKHFPGALNIFRVLVIAPHPQWRDSLQAAFAERPHPELYRFAALPELNKDTFLFEPVWRDHKGVAVSLLARPEGVVAGSATGSERGVRSAVQKACGVTV